MKNWRISDAWSVLRLHDKREKFRDPGFGCSVSSSTSLARATTDIASGAQLQTLSEFGYAVASSIYSSWMRSMNTKTAVRPKARVLKDIYTERDSQSHKTAKGKKLSVRTLKVPGFDPKGIHRFILPFTVFLKLKDIGANVLPGYQEEFVDVAMSLEQGNAYAKLAGTSRFEGGGTAGIGGHHATGRLNPRSSRPRYLASRCNRRKVFLRKATALLMSEEHERMR